LKKYKVFDFTWVVTRHGTARMNPMFRADCAAVSQNHRFYFLEVWPTQEFSPENVI